MGAAARLRVPLGVVVTAARLAAVEVDLSPGEGELWQGDTTLPPVIPALSDLAALERAVGITTTTEEAGRG